MAMIDSLPLELLALVLSLSFDEYGSPECYRTMRVAALLCRSWTALACGQLWRSVMIRTVKQAEALAVSPAVGRYRTHKFTVDTTECGAWVEKAVEGLVGVKTLETSGPAAGVSPDFLRLPSLSGLESLTLGSIQFARLLPSSPLPPFPLPFHLTSLTLGNNFHGPVLAISLISSSSQTLTHLDLSGVRNIRHQIYFNTHPLPPTLATPKLRALKFNYCFLALVLHILRTCELLEELSTSLTYVPLLDTVFEAVPRPLVSLGLPGLRLVVDFSDEVDESAIYEIPPLLCRHFAAGEGGTLSKLKELRVGVREGELDEFEEGRGLLATLERREVLVVFGPPDLGDD